MVLRPERPELRFEKLDLRLKRPDLGFQKPDLGSQRPDLGSQRPDLGPEGPAEGGTNKRMNEQTDERTKVPLCSTGLRPLRRPLPCFLSLRFTIIQSRVMGITDHILPLGDLLTLKWVENLSGFDF